MHVDELIELLNKVQHKEARVIFRCTSCGRCNQVQEVVIRHDLKTDDIIVELAEEC
jgi:Fe-S oxidoreductase